MISQAVKEALERFVPAENIKYEEPFMNYATFRTGGPAACMLSVQNEEELRNVLHYLTLVELPFFVLGNGSNLLVADKGYRGIVIRTAPYLNKVEVDGCRVRAGAGALLSVVAKAACEHGLTGLEFAAGIPGTVGGGVIMNAGAYGGELKQVVEHVTVLDKQGNLLTLDNETMEFGYRTSVIKNQKFVVTECSFLLQEGETPVIRAKMEELASQRREKQPLEFPSAGSTFKRPEGHFAGKLIMEAGLKGFQVGGARVSDKHSGFIINMGEATAADIKELIEQVQQRVYEHAGVRLEPEVIMLGDF